MPRSVFLFAGVIAIAAVLFLLPRFSEEEASPPPAPLPADVILQSDVEACLGGAQAATGCTQPALQACLASPDECTDELRVLVTDEPASTTGEGSGDLLVVVLAVIAPFALVLVPLGWRTIRRTRRRNAEAFADQLPELVARGFVVSDDPAPGGFELRQACQRASRILVRDAEPRIWLFESSRPRTLVADHWPVRSAVVELPVTVPTGRVFPSRDAARAGDRFVGRFSTDPGDFLDRVRPVIDGAYPEVLLFAKRRLVQVATCQKPRTGLHGPLPAPLALAEVADLAEAVAAALTVDAAEV